jgi:type I restriction enzyme S subunit
MVNSKLGKIPGGWEVRRLGDVLDLVYGDALKAEDRIEGPIPVYGSSGIIGYHNESMVKGPGIIVGRKGNVGSVYWSDDDFFPIDTVYYVQTDKSSPFIYFNLLTQNFINNDAAVPGLNRKQALNLPIIIPTEGLLKIFESAILPVFKYIKQIKQESDNLRQTRDLLLPKLVSGEVEV